MRTRLPQHFPSSPRKRKLNGKLVAFDKYSNGLLNIVGIHSEDPPELGPVRWFEPLDPSRLRPANLYHAQRLRRLRLQGIDTQPPVAKFEARLEAPLSVAFSAKESHDADGPVVSFFWKFGDGGTSREMSPTHHYPKPGTYQGCLMVWDQHGSRGELSFTIVLP
ncbi:MAG: PKD domain-containing protein [Lentisphaerae bacterium]|nr:MAG: PKD domain-containing protein [Lentisphaerota bacterium]